MSSSRSLQIFERMFKIIFWSMKDHILLNMPHVPHKTGLSCEMKQNTRATLISYISPDKSGFDLNVDQISWKQYLY